MALRAMQAAANATSVVAKAVRAVADAVASNLTEANATVGNNTNVTDGSGDDPNGVSSAVVLSFWIVGSNVLSFMCD